MSTTRYTASSLRNHYRLGPTVDMVDILPTLKTDLNVCAEGVNRFHEA